MAQASFSKLHAAAAYCDFLVAQNTLWNWLPQDAGGGGAAMFPSFLKSSLLPGPNCPRENRA